MKSAKHILVVEDEKHLAIGIKYNLEEEGYSVITVGDGPGALRHVADHPSAVDLVILDIMLPGMSGYAVCESLRESGENMPILILSARTLAEDRTRGFDVGADQYLTKPFDLDELLSRVKNLLNLYSRRADNNHKLHSPVGEFQFGNASINFETFDVTVDDKPVRLTQMQMKLLQYFVENEGRVVSRSELLEKIWGMPGHLQTRAPDQFMRKLRKTFEPDPARPRHFLTVRDAGYRFLASP
jgi:two-component system OmpR family response regulator